MPLHPPALRLRAVRLLTAVACLMALVQTATAQPRFGERPRLVVGVVVDQMRWDYLSRYYDTFTADGFRRLIDQGYSCDNCLIDYLPTVTAIGHASAYTGSTPALHGICGNNFYIDGRKTYCCADSTVQTVGSATEKGRMSPRNLLATTIGDQLRLHTDFRSKVVGVSYKDRAAILPAGHAANAAYWLDTKSRCFVTSTYYMDRLPQWAQRVNDRMATNADLKAIDGDVGFHPLCGTLITDMAIAALEGERLGQTDGQTDMLCVSYSQTDVIGHKWGTRGTHTDDAYLQLDRDLGRLLTALDRQVGAGQYLLFLTADHGAAHNFAFMQEHHLPAGPWSSEQLCPALEAHLRQTLGTTENVVADVLDYRLFLSRDAIAAQGLDEAVVRRAITDYLRTAPHAVFAVDFEQLQTAALPPLLRDRALMGYHPRRSGDILMIPEPGYYEYGSWSSPVGTTHGEWNPYDSHIPLLFFGWQVPHGATAREVHITDIAPTVCQLLHIQQPNACVGQPIAELFAR